LFSIAIQWNALVTPVVAPNVQHEWMSVHGATPKVQCPATIFASFIL